MDHRFITQLFSLQPGHMRGFHAKRILVALLILPVFSFLFLVHHFFLLLDRIIFPAFQRQAVERPIFIVSMPRSGTTFLLHTLARQKEDFTCVRLWEIILAPSICQKYLLLRINRLDTRLGRPLRKTWNWIEQRSLAGLNRIHPIGLNLPEEDEAFLLWNLQSGYLNYFYPDTRFLEDFLRFDHQISGRKKKRLMRKYYRYVQRHNYVFNRNNTRRFLSKNPLMMSKVASLHSVFPDAQLLNINRSPGRVLPSTLALNRYLYSFFSARPTPPELEARTYQLLIDWYQMAETGLQAHFAQNHLKLDFNLLVSLDLASWASLANWLELPTAEVFAAAKKASQNKRHSSQSRYQSLSQAELDDVLHQLPFLSR